MSEKIRKLPPTSQIEATKWKPGQSGNPAGRPKGAVNLTTVLQKLIDKEFNYKDPFTKKTQKNLSASGCACNYYRKE